METRTSPFADYQRGSANHDEFLTENGDVQEKWRSVSRALGQMGGSGIAARDDEARKLVRVSTANFQLPRNVGDQVRPWQLSIMPLIIDESEWKQVSAGLAQRVRVLERVLGDILGEQHLLREGILPPQLLFANPLYFRAFRDLPFRSCRLSLTATDLARNANGSWYVTGDRTRAPSGLGFALENRIITGQVLPRIFRDSNVIRLASFFSEYQGDLERLADGNTDHQGVGILTASENSYRFVEDAYLARYLGFTLVQGRDLAVRGNQVYLKTLGGLSRIHALQRNISDHHCDPIELDANSTVGTAGLLGAVRTGAVNLTNSLGSILAQMPALLPYLPDACRYFFDEELALPTLNTYWCGDASQRNYVLDNLNQLLLRNAFSISGTAPIDPSLLSKSEKEGLSKEILAEPERFVAQGRQDHSTTPVWSNGGLKPWKVALRTFQLQKDGAISVLPGGLARVAPDGETLGYSPQSGRLGQDCWVLSSTKELNPVTLLPSPNAKLKIRRTGSELPSRVAENFFWLGRHVERTEAIARLMRTLIQRLTSETFLDGQSDIPRLTASLAAVGQIEADDAIEEFKGRRHSLETALIQSIYHQPQPYGVHASIEQMVEKAIATRDRLSPDAYQSITRIGDLLERQGPDEVELSVLLGQMNELVSSLLTFAGLTAETMTRTLGWRLLQLGRRIERGFQTCEILAATLAYPVENEPPLLESVMRACDSIMTYRSRYMLQFEVAPTLDLLVFDRTNPRSLAFQFDDIFELLDQLTHAADEARRGLDQEIAGNLKESIACSVPSQLTLVNDAGCRSNLWEMLQFSLRNLPKLSDAISSRYLIHTNIERRITA